MKPYYKVKDYYDCTTGETLGYANTWEEVKEITRERIEDTDGECYVMALPLDKEQQKYNPRKTLVVRV